MIDDLGRTPPARCSHRRPRAFICGSSVAIRSRRAGVQTNPISGEPGGWGQQTVRNKANSPERPKMGAGPQGREAPRRPMAQNEPNLAYPLGAAAREMCETKPISAGAGRGRRTRNKPNLGLGRQADRAPESENAQNEPNLSIATVQNKANLGPGGRPKGRWCETNPIPGRDRRRGRLSLGPVVQTNPISAAGPLYKQSQFGPRGGTKGEELPPGRFCQTKPICRPGGSDTVARDDSAKQSQSRGSDTGRTAVSSVKERSSDVL
jgi:hypothetical protein